MFFTLFIRIDSLRDSGVLIEIHKNPRSSNLEVATEFHTSLANALHGDNVYHFRHASIWVEIYKLTSFNCFLFNDIDADANDSYSSFIYEISGQLT